jgi:hypothetical protein
MERAANGSRRDYRGLSATEYRVAVIAKAINENVAPADAAPLDNNQSVEIIKWLESYGRNSDGQLHHGQS